MADTTNKSETRTKKLSIPIPYNQCGQYCIVQVHVLVNLLAHAFGINSAILEAMPQLDIQLAPQNDARRVIVLSLPPQIDADSMPMDVADAIRGLWKDPSVKEAVRRSREFQLNDSAV